MSFCAFTVSASPQQSAVAGPVGLAMTTTTGCSWSASSSTSWIATVTTSGSGSGTASFTIADQTLSITQAGDSAPFGWMDLPSNNTTNASGAVAVTGWALSANGIATVGVWRDPVNGETPTPNGYVFLDNAYQVAGSRPDVAQAYPNYPNNNWGWGMLVLTNTLPGTDGLPAGNGTYRFHAIATDTTGLSSEVGASSISVNNAGSVLPFGTIDTPAEGQTISGKAYVNFGWALTPEPNTIPTSGSTITVYIDNLPAGHPVYDLYRSDVSTSFPNLQNSAGPVGYLRIDTTKLTNGLHQISWSVTDSAKHTAGLGSRFFIVQN